MIQRWKERARQLKREVYALALAAKDPRVPWHVRLLAGGVIAYAFSPIDLIPDFIPILGYLDDLILIPLGVALVIRLLPAEVLADCRARAQERIAQGKPISWLGAAVIVAIWLLLALLALRALL